MATGFDRIPKPGRKLARVNPVISALQFATQTANEGGATMSSRGRVMAPGEDEAFMVGGHPAKEGKGEEGRVPTLVVPKSSVTPINVLRHRERIKDLASQVPDRASLGSWVNPATGKVEIDAATTVFRRDKGIRLMKERGEKAIWDNKKQVEILPDGSER